MGLNPTLWRTCRALANRRRLRLLKEILETPGRTVKVLAAAVGIPMNTASLYLRHLNSRGLLRAQRVARFVRYYPEADGSVKSAAPLLATVADCILHNSRAVECIYTAVTAMTHPRRIEVMRHLVGGPLSTGELQRLTHISRSALKRHLLKLEKRAFVKKLGENRWEAIRPKDRLERCLISLALS